MDVKELEQWLETEEGQNWLEDKKAPLLKKRDELLEQNKALRADLSQLKTEADGQREATQREQNALKKVLIDDRLNSLMEQHRVFPQLRNALRSELEEQGLEVIPDGESKKAVVGSDQKELSEYMAEWADSEEAAEWKMPPENRGAGILGPGDDAPRGDAEAAAYAQELDKYMK